MWHNIWHNLTIKWTPNMAWLSDEVQFSAAFMLPLSSTPTHFSGSWIDSRAMKLSGSSTNWSLVSNLLCSDPSGWKIILLYSSLNDIFVPMMSVVCSRCLVHNNFNLKFQMLMSWTLENERKNKQAHIHHASSFTTYTQWMTGWALNTQNF